MEMPKGIPIVPHEIVTRVMAEVGFPVITFEDLGIKEQDALELFIFPAMQKYFAYNPNVLKTTHPISGKIELPFPNEYTFGVLQARVSISEANNVITKRDRVFYSYRERSSGTANRNNLYDNPYYTKSVILMEDLARNASISLSRAGNMEIDRDARVLRGFSNIAGELIVTWAQCSDNWKDIRFEHEAAVVDLAKAHALRYFGMLRTQMDPNTGVQMNGDAFISRADSIEEKIMETWTTKPRVIVSR